jgi:hypothetical protein
MATYQVKNSRSKTRCRPRAALVKWVAAALLLAFPAQAMAVDSAFVRSLVIPGSGQAQQGHYTRAAVYAGTAVLSGFGFVLAWVSYNESSDKFNREKATYESYQDTLDNGGVVSIKDIEDTYAQMQTEHEAAVKRFRWRNGFLAVLGATYAVNLIDVLKSKPYQADKDQPVSLEASPDGVWITKTIRF